MTYRDSGGVTTKSIDYAYDPFDRRIARWLDADGDGVVDDEQRFVFDQGVKNSLDDCLLVFDDAGSLIERYLYGPAVDQPLAVEDASGVLWMLADPLGTVHDLAELNAGTGTTSVVNHLAYDSFGKITSQTNPSQRSRYGFTGREWDSDAGLWWYRARWYDSQVGRFVSEDPIGFAGGDVSLTRYVGNTATQMTDPWGQRGRCASVFDCFIQHSSIRVRAKKLHSELRRYDPVADGKGGHPIPGQPGKFTKPGGHCEEIRNHQRGLNNKMARYVKECIDCDDPDNPGRSHVPVPRWIDEMANRPILQPVYPTTRLSQPVITPPAGTVDSPSSHVRAYWVGGAAGAGMATGWAAASGGGLGAGRLGYAPMK